MGPAQYAIAVRVKGDGRERLLRDVTRLSALPDDKHPLLVYLGLLEDRKTAVFLVPSVVEVVSDGACQPSQTACERVHLRRGETMYFEHTAGGRQLQYELELRGVHRRRQGTRPTASSAAASARSRKFARWLVSLQEERLGGIRWEAARGYLVYPAN